MKKKILIIILASFMITGIVSAASSMWGEYKGKPIIRLTVDGVPMKVSDAPAVLMDDRTMVPIYLLAQAGVQYEWDGKNQTVDIKRSNDNNEFVELMKLVKYYKELEDFGEEILDSSNRLFVLSEDMLYIDSNTSTKPTEDHLTRIFSKLNTWKNESSSVINSYSPTETLINDILSGYVDAYNSYSDAMVKLIRYKMYIDSGDMNMANQMLDIFYSSADKAHQTISASINKASDRHAFLINYLVTK